MVVRIIVLISNIYQSRREREVLERTPNERFIFFLRLVAEIGKFQTLKERTSNNFILERKR